MAKLAVNCIVFGILLFMLMFDAHAGNAEEECNLFNGQWVPDPSGPSYDTSCYFIDSSVNCIKNGRPDSEYLHWRWKPHGCSAPPALDAERFMRSMRDKSWAFIGDSILRNQMQSLTCMLFNVERPIETYHDATNKSRTFYFPSHNLTLATIWAPFLVKHRSKPDQELQVYLDVLDEIWTKDYTAYDYVVIASGQWYLKTTVMWENNHIIGCHNCAENYPDVSIEYAYRQSLKQVFNFIASSEHKPLVFFRTWMPSHFEFGDWHDGGICNRTVPYGEGECKGKEFDQLLQTIEVEEFELAAGLAAGRGVRMEMLNTFHMSLLRPDGHPGAYRTYRPFDHKDEHGRVQYDCLHSCLPGPVDAWNDLMMKKLVDAGVVGSDEDAGESSSM